MHENCIGFRHTRSAQLNSGSAPRGSDPCRRAKLFRNREPSSCGSRVDGSLPHRHKIAIAGNHDLLFEPATYSGFHALAERGVIYLQGSETIVGGCLSTVALGSPSSCTGRSTSRVANSRKYWKQIPTGLDILITHGPPYGILDREVPPGLRRLAPWEDEEPYNGSSRGETKNCLPPDSGSGRGFMFSATFTVATEPCKICTPCSTTHHCATKITNRSARLG